MITKYELTSALAEETTRQIARNGQEWAKYLNTAARLYKYPFEDQVLIYAQRPNATACATLETWNEKMNCWVNRGAKGIALIDRDSDRRRLRYVFDVADVHKARRIGREPYLWQMREEHQETVLKQLEKTYGETDGTLPFEQRVMEIANRIAADYYGELMPELLDAKEGSFLEELDDLNVGIRLRDTLASSISYTLLSRCGADMDMWRDELDFSYISDFNTTRALAVLGTATADTCKPILMEIGRTIGAYEREAARNRSVMRTNGEQVESLQNNTEKGLAKDPETDYNALKRESETEIHGNNSNQNHIETEGAAHETDIREKRGLSDTEPESGRGAGGGSDEVRHDAEEFSQGEPQGDLQWNASDGRAEGALPQGAGAGRGEDGSPDGADGESGGRGREAQSYGSDEVGADDEWDQALGGGDRTDGADLRISEPQQNMESPEPGIESSTSMSGSSFMENLMFAEKAMDIQRGVLCSDTMLKHKRPEIAGYFEMEKSADLQSEYLKNSFPMGVYFALEVADTKVGVHADEKGLYMNMSGQIGAEHEVFMSWEDARYWVNSYMEDGVYLLPGETAEQIETDGMYKQMDLFTMFSEQVGTIAVKEAAEVFPILPATRIPQEQLDDILRSGSGHENSRKRIFAKYQQGKTPEEMADFLKKEYGTTGKGFEFDGRQVAVWFDEQGMSIGHGTSGTDHAVLNMDWNEVEAVIRSQVESGTYMSSAEAFLVESVERERIGNALYYFFSDGMGEVPEEFGIERRIFPSVTEKMMDLLSTPEGIALAAAKMDEALAQLENGEKKLRFRSVLPKEELRAELDNLRAEKVNLPTADYVEVKHEDFITQDEIDHRLGKGSGFSHGSFRIYEYFTEGSHDSKEAVTFLKNEYGTGGSSHALAGNDHSWEDHDGKGIRLRKGDLSAPYNDVLLSWKVVEKRIRKLIHDDKYLTADGKAAYAAYKEEQAQKALVAAQEKMERETKVSCKEAIEKKIAERFDGKRLPKEAAEEIVQEYGIERVSFVLATTVAHKGQDGRFSDENKAWAKEIEPYAMYENRDLVINTHPALLNGFINQTRRIAEQEKALETAEKESQATEQAAEIENPETDTSGHDVQRVTVAIECSEDFSEPDIGFYTHHYADGREGERFRLVTTAEDGLLVPYPEHNRFFINRELIQEYIDTHADELDVIGYDEMVFQSMQKQAEYKHEQSKQEEKAQHEQGEPDSTKLTDLEKKAVEIAKGYENLPLTEKIGVIAQTFGCMSGEIETSPCTGKWRGTSDISIRFDNGASFYLGNYRTPQAKTEKVQNECVNAAIVRFNPEIVAATKEAAIAPLREREAKDNEIAAQKGLKPYTLLNVEISDGTDDMGGHLGWYYVTIAVDGQIHAHLETGLNYDIANGRVSENPKRENYYVAGAIKEEDVDYVFNNVGFSSTDGSYSLSIGDDVLERAQKTLAERREAEEREPGETEQNHRFSVTVTSDAFGEEDAYAVWDELNEDYYTGSDGWLHTFETETEAQEYLAQVEKEFSEKEMSGKEQDGEETPQKSEQTIYPGEKNGLPYDIVVEKLHFDDPEKNEPEQSDDTPLEPDIEIPTAKAEPQIDKTNAVNFRITDDALGVGGAKEKFRRNIEAITTLKRIESENRIATPEEQRVLSQYVGWGGLADAFDESKSNWSDEFAQLKGLLSESEYASARESTLNAHYTSPTIIRSIYEALGRMGFEKGNILEPAMGIGNFFGMLPENMQGSRLYGVELDGITGRIAKQLYPNADIQVTGFEKTAHPNDFFDVAIGNVPFGTYKVADKKYDKNNFLIHDYFFAKTLDKVRPGGVVAFVTSKGTLDKKSPEVRKYLAQRAELLGAVRLPNTAFKENAGTEVTSDIIFLKKRDRVMDIEPDWVHLSENEDGIAVNSYFAQHPEMVVGKMEMVSGPFGMESTCQPDTSRPFEEQLREAVSRIDGTIDAVELDELEDELADMTLPADPAVKNFSYTLVDDKVYYRENSIMKPVDMADGMLDRIRGMVGIRNCTQELINLQLEESPESAIREKQAELNGLYDAFSKKFGIINSQTNKRAFNQDSSYCLLCSLEKLDEEGNFQGKADMFSKRTIKKAEVVTSVDTASEALAVSLAEKAGVDLDYMASLMLTHEQYMDGETYNATLEKITEELTGVIFQNPVTDRWETADEYLSGNVRDKLETAKIYAENHPEYTVNVQALTQVQPKDLDASEIEVRIGATWIKPEYIEQFMRDTFDTPQSLFSRDIVGVQFSDITGEWRIKGKNADYGNALVSMTYGTSRRNAYQILEDSLNLKDSRVYDTIVEDGKEKRVLNQ